MPQLNPSHPLVVDASRTYGVTPEFVISYMNYQGFEVGDAYLDWAGFRESLNSLSKMYVDFAMTCAVRARSAIDAIAAPLPTHPGALRYLDVGCGYGGFVREFALRGYDSTGIELQQHLAEFSRANCCDLPEARIINSDLFAVDTSDLGRFDLITCNDVIEHVQDARAAISIMASMLRPGGTLFMEIPNKDCIESVRSDGHYQVFGPTLLERNAAAALVEGSSGMEGYLREMGEMYELDYYCNALREEGLDVAVKQVHRIGGLREVPRLTAELTNAFSEWTSQTAPKLDASLRGHVTKAFALYMARLWQEFEHASSRGSAHAFELRYLNSFWTVIARRSTVE